MENIPNTPLLREMTLNNERSRRVAEVTLTPPSKTRIITISNQKGGVGKTTSAVNLAAALARKGMGVLVIDLDPQGNASTALGVEHHNSVVGSYEVLVQGVPMLDAVKQSPEHHNLYCLPATINLAGAEIDMVSVVNRERVLLESLTQFLADFEHPIHFVFIDSPPSLGLLTVNALVAAGEVLVPIQCEYYALEGLSQLIRNIQLIQKHLNSNLKLSTILLTMYDSRTNLSAQVAADVREHFPQQALQSVIPRSVRVSEAPSYQQPVITYDKSSTGSLAYLEAAIELANRGA